ncbi:hypothetical protein DOTSEDRAFT_68425 [Dothistroma septosporum NZE10]|uniref:Uncharacterized protein n=1 Tax=Dothistroma septosporum (strain NZE10 / CBS 128990) TaxID=675120 RepID=N1Q4R1_DOTSN|nr:hypothetical protein DOTSEDRAFT_68425 [Dothistroma septosporum NZE10]
MQRSELLTLPGAHTIFQGRGSWVKRWSGHSAARYSISRTTKAAQLAHWGRICSWQVCLSRCNPRLFLGEAQNSCKGKGRSDNPLQCGGQARAHERDNESAGLSKPVHQDVHGYGRDSARRSGSGTGSFCRYIITRYRTTPDDVCL